ncbi:hypothetical protein E2C01_016489 [Portunus trituberculatus]|uniref:Uncharacterized protein n=1 Tax=Portunus trituberculatus TaxID=210409 RepID=A0A5B7DPI7_PORTR|nr:hypothetical protein [Portunus trituberculatus]
MGVGRFSTHLSGCYTCTLAYRNTCGATCATHHLRYYLVPSYGYRALPFCAKDRRHHSASQPVSQQSIRQSVNLSASLSINIHDAKQANTHTSTITTTTTTTTTINTQHTDTTTINTF